LNWLPRPAEGRTYVAPSLLSADFTDLRTDLASMTAGGANLFHLDIMDGHFVPNLTFGPFICRAIRKITDLPLDAHLMITQPGRYLESFAAAGVDGLTVHVEAEGKMGEILDRIGELGLRRGMSLRPATPIERVRPWLDRLDLILVMSVEPGFGGQEFDPGAVGKIAEFDRQRRADGHQFLISVDGGINAETGARCRQAGADILVSGSWLFGAEDRARRISLLARGG
jgi:ribulose-phosphate 3-epimerase